jgi:malonyl-CoA/methylmalonyl-CoA synthetase
LTRFDPERVIELMEDATVLMGVPTFYTRLLASNKLNQQSCRNMRLFISGSAPLLPATFNAFNARTGHCILERYGMTETLMNSSNPLDGDRKLGSVGFPLPGVEIRIRGSEGELADQGEAGEIEIRGDNLFDGYWRMTEKTAEELRPDGFFKTGDIGLFDKEGYLFIVGRLKDLIISGGLNVYPKEVESIIDTLDDIAESAVIGVPHPDFGEGVVAVVTTHHTPGLEADEQRIIQSTKARLASYKAPKAVCFVDNLPRNAMGKVEKNKLRERFTHLFDS